MNTTVTNTPLFTVEEENLICIFQLEKKQSRAALIGSIMDAMPYFDEPELTEVAENALDKLIDMSDEEYEGLTFHPTYHSGGEEDAE